MKNPGRRLGRGLGAFLDFDPAGDDGAAFIADALNGGTKPLLQTSTTSGEAKPVRVAPPAARAPAPVAPPPAPRVIVPPPVPLPEPQPEFEFVDDVIVTDDEFVLEPEPAPAAPTPAPRAAAPAPPPPPPPAPAPEPVSESSFLDEEIVTGIAFPEVDLE